MPVPSLFKRKSRAKDSDKKAKQKENDARTVFSGDESLLQIHAETAELLRLVKTPAVGPKVKSPSAKQTSTGASVKRAPVRQTIEVLEEEEDDEAQGGNRNTVGSGAAMSPASLPLGDELLTGSRVDPFAFDAEEARVRRASDTFLPDTSPSKQDVGRQRSHLTREQVRLQRIESLEDTDKQRRVYEAENRPVVNRVEASAIRIQAHSRGFLARKHAEEDRKTQAEQAEREMQQQEAAHWHEVRDVDRNEVWYYNALTGQSQWERPAATALQGSLSTPELPAIHTGSHTTTPFSAGITRTGSVDLPPLSPSTSRPNSSSSSVSGRASRPQSSSKRSPLLPSLGGTSTTTSATMVAFDYGTSTSNPWECDSVVGSVASDQMSLCSERLEDADDRSADFSRGRRSQLHVEDTTAQQQQHDSNDDWLVNDSLFRADGSKNSKLRDTIRNALQTSKFDSVSSLVASNVVLRNKPVKGRQSLLLPDTHSNQRNGYSPSRARQIVLGRRDAPLFVAVLDKKRNGPNSSTPLSPVNASKLKRRPPSAALAIGKDPSNPLASTPQIRDLIDPGLYDGLSTAKASPTKAPSPEKTASAGPTAVCFNCWSSSTGRHCEVHADANDLRKVKSSESALMCGNWKLDQLRRKYRSEEIQELFMKQNASLRYDKRLKQYITVIEAKHPIYRRTEQLTAAWNKTMRRKLHTRAWFQSFIEQLRAGGVPKADASTPKLMKLKNTIQNNRWCAKYSDSVREFHPKAPVTVKTQSSHVRHPILDVIMVDPAHPQLKHWILKTDCTRPIELYKPRKYELPPRRCVPMPTPSFLEEIPLPVPNIYIDCGHIASWFERLSARVAMAAMHKALLQIQACSPPRGATDARRTKHVTPVTVLFATFGRKPTSGMLAVGGLSAELLIHMLVTTYIPAQYGHFIVFDRRAIAPNATKDYDAVFVCMEIDPTTMRYVFRALEHALNVRRPPCIVLSTRAFSSETESDAAQRRFPANRPDQTGEESAHGFRTFWLVEAFAVPDDVECVAVQPTADVLSPNATSMNATMTTKVDRFYPFCSPTTKANTPLEFIHLLWIGQSSRNQPQTFTTLGAQQPGEFMQNSNPDGALGVCTSVIYRSWAYMQSSPFDEFTTDDGIAYWYDKQNGETFWSRPILPVEKHRGKDGDVDGVVVHGIGEVATLGIGVDGNARYSQHDLRKYMTKKLEATEDKEKRLRLVSASARKHELVVTLDNSMASKPYKDFAKVQVPKLEFRKKGIAGTGSSKPTSLPSAGLVLPPSSPLKSTLPPQKTQGAASPTKESSSSSMASVDANTQQLIATITQALGSALPSGAHGSSGVDMLQLGIGLGMGLGLRSSQQQPQHQQQRLASSSRVRSSSRSRPLSAESQVAFADEIEEEEGEEPDEDDDDAMATTARSDGSSVLSDVSSTARSIVSVAVGPSPDELELLPEVERAKLLRAGDEHNTPGYRTHAPPGHGHTWVDKPIDGSAESQTAVDGYGGSVHQRVACLPKDFVAAVSSTKTCKMQANYLPVTKNTNQPRSVGIVRPRTALDEWLPVGYSPWSAGRSVFGTQLIRNLMSRPELVAAQKNGITSASPVSSGAAAAVQIEKKENVTQAVKEAQQLETVFSLCRHGKYDDLEKTITSPDWTLPIDAKDATGNTLLSIACQNNNKRIAKLCLRRGADINTQNLNGQTLLHYCHEYGFHDLMDYLLDKGAKDDVVNADGLTCYEGLTKEAVDSI